MKLLRMGLLAGAVSILLPAALNATPARRGFRTFTQPDGREISLQVVGDERGHIYMTPDNKPAMLFDGAFYYINQSPDGSRISNSGLLVGRDPAPAITAQTALDGLNRRRAVARRIPAGKDMLDGNVPTTGTQKGLVILVQYSDVKFTLDDPVDYYDRFFHEENFSDYGGTGSARQYFIDSSRGMYEPEFDVYGPVTLKFRRSYYGSNAANGDDAKAAEMAVEAVKQLDEDVDFSQYDTDGDGFIDNVTVIYAGQGEADYGPADSVWPHMWYVYSGDGIQVKVDGVMLDRYNCINEWSEYSPCGIATFCHEFSHVLGLPDIYDVTYSAYDYTPGIWTVMDSGTYNNDGNTPPLHSIYEAYSLGWVKPEELTEAGEITLEPSTREGYIIPTERENEFYMIEARSRKGWDEYLPADGMLVWHIDFDAKKWTANTVNTDAMHQRIDLVEADNKPGERTARGDAFPGTGGLRKTLNSETSPALVSWAGRSLGWSLEDITLNSDKSVTLSVVDDHQLIDPAFTQITVNQTSIALEWTAVSEGTGYEMRIRDLGSDQWVNGWECKALRNTAIKEGSQPGTLAYEVKGLTTDREYELQLRAVDTEENLISNWTAPLRFVPGKGVGIDDIIDDAVDAPAEYFDLRGIRVSNPIPGNIYIRRRGTVVDKVAVM